MSVATNIDRKYNEECEKCRKVFGEDEKNIEENPFLSDIDIYLKVLKDGGLLNEDEDE